MEAECLEHDTPHNYVSLQDNIHFKEHELVNTFYYLNYYVILTLIDSEFLQQWSKYINVCFICVIKLLNIHLG